MTLAIDGTNQATSATMVTSISLSTTNTNDFIFLMITTNSTDLSTGPYVTGVSSTHTTGWARQASANTAAGFQTLDLWRGKAASPLSSESISLTYTGSSSDYAYGYIDAFGVSGANFVSPVDASGFTTQTTAGSTVNVTTTSGVSQWLLIGGYNFNSTGSPTAGAGWTILPGSGVSSFQLTEYKIVNVKQSGVAVPIGTGNADENTGIAGGIVGPCIPGALALMGVGACWLAYKIDENPIVTRRGLILPC